jgi:hypothetical protein
LDDFEQLLRDALDLLRELGEADDQDDRSHWDLPSIAPHWQNRGFRDWVTLIELLRDAWLETYKSMPERARQIAIAWFDVPYPTFKRLALFAASQDGAIDAAKWVDCWCSKDRRCRRKPENHWKGRFWQARHAGCIERISNQRIGKQS